ncbi:MAG: S8 family serine peptidase [Bacteroidales bacterium]|nr:S8 family serine peptidase [Bacteroidales bacterium]
MKNILLLFAFSVLIAGAFAQVAPDKYWVKFTDKNNSPFSIENPGDFLTQRAIDRRTAYSIPVDESDLPVNPVYLQGVAATGATVLTTSRWFNSVTVYTTSSSVIDAINNLPYVQSVLKASSPSGTNADPQDKPFFSAEEYMVSAPDGLKSQSSASTYNYGDAYNQIHMLNGDLLHDMGYNGNGMVIAVLDAGFLNADNLAAFDSIWDNGRVLGYKDFVSPQDPNLFNSHFHGTAVLSTMAANLPGVMVGTAPGASYWLLRSEDGATENLIEELNWVSAAEYADSVGADVINSSLGYTVLDDPAWSHTYADMDGNTTPITIGADKAMSKGMIVVNSAGNSGGSAWLYIGAPADGDSVFSIGAVDANGNYAGFSSVGPTHDGRLKPNVVAQGQGTAFIDPGSGGVAFGSGTSFSSPITAGLVACLWQANHSARNTYITAAIEQSASLYSNPNMELGHGIPDYALANSILTIIGHPDLNPENMTVSPSPFGAAFSVKMQDQAEIFSVSLFDIAGKKVLEVRTSGSSAEIDGLDVLEAGFYIVRVETSAGLRTGKVQKR